PRTFDRTAAKIFEVFRGADFYFSTWDSDYNQQLTSLFESYNPESVRPAPGSTSNPLTCMAI
ncbi:hypothetical protein, partial [Ligilactobacillus salivarius]|uniref:hypothetical protein n=1 Tax=Ligilactobacillus salivarius TaxID=1624 RepID=UPI001D0BF46D